MFTSNRPKWLGILLACLLISGIVIPSMQGLVAAQERSDDDRRDDERQNGESEENSEEGMDDQESGDQVEESEQPKDESEEDDRVKEEENGNQEDADESEDISEEEAAELAIQALEELYGDADYSLVESKYDDGEYIFIIKSDERIFEVEVDAEDGSVEEIKEIEEEDLEKEEKEEDEDGALQNTVLIGRENITQIAIRYLNDTYGDQNYTITEIELDGEEYEIKATDGVETFELKIDAKSGDILSIEVERKDREDDREKKDEDKEDDEKIIAPKITMEEASSIAVDFLTANFGEANYTITKIELDEGEYEVEVTDGERKFELKIDGETGMIIESEVEELEEEDMGMAEQPAMTMQEAIDAAMELLIQQFGERNYTVTEIEFDEGEFKIEMRDDAGGKYEFEIDAATGRIVEFEGKTRELKVEIELEDDDELKIEVKERDLKEEKKSFKVKVKKNEPKFKLEFEVKENVTKSDLELELLFDSLTEYLDNGTSVGILDANDTVIATINLSELKWSITRSEKTGENGTITAVTINQTGTGNQISNITFTYHLTPTTRTISVTNGTELSVKVWEVKFDIHLEGYNWTRTDTALALSGTFNTEFEVKLKGEEQIKFKAIDGITPFFSWGGEAVADGATIDVQASASKNRVTLFYPHFNSSLTHDPTIGYLIPIALPPIEVLVPVVVIAGGAVIVTTLAAVSIMRSRRIRKDILRLPGV